MYTADRKSAQNKGESRKEKWRFEMVKCHVVRKKDIESIEDLADYISDKCGYCIDYLYYFELFGMIFAYHIIYDAD